MAAEPFFLFALLFISFSLAGHYLNQQAATFIRNHEVYSGDRFYYANLLTVLFAFLASLIFLRGWFESLPWETISRDILLLGWLLVLTHFDLAKRWMPFPFTFGLSVTGFLFSLLPQTPLTFWHALTDWALMFGLLYGFRFFANRGGIERFGLGDVHFLAGLSVWLTLPVVAWIFLGALGFIIIQWLLGLLHSKNKIPFAPYVSASLALAILYRFPS